MSQFQLHELLDRDCVELIDLPVSKLLLMNDSQFPWFVLVPRIENVQDIYQLNWNEQQQFLNESSMLSEILMTLFKGDKMNVAALGNVCPQLHVHHIVRYKSDIAWPKPIWGLFEMQPYTSEEIERIKAKVLPSISAILNKEE